MKKRLNKTLYILFAIIILSFSACSLKKEKDEKEVEIVDAKSLIENIVKENEKSDKNKDISKNSDNKISDKDSSNKDKSSKEVKANKEIKDKNKKSKNNLKTVKIKAFGDIMSHMGQMTYARNKGGESGYDFSDQFLYIKDFIKDADLSIGNFETTANPDEPISGYPRFNTDISYPKYLKDAGFDILTTANNHCLDTGEEGVFSTIKAIEDAGLLHVGTQKENEDRIIYKTINDIKIAFLSYTYGVNGLESSVVNVDVDKIVNFLDEDKIEKDIKTAKNNDADFILVYPHWGEEYQSYPSQDQIYLARKIIDWGADIVIGNHPHVVEPGEFYESKDGRKGFIAYALGNFISEQSYDTLGDIRTEQSVAYEIDLSKDMKNGSTTIENVKAHPLWVGRSYNEYGSSIQTYLISDFLGNGKNKDLIDQYQEERMRKAQDMVSKIVVEDVE
ncbi:MAG: CapA family protein [Peptoniphilaceae bacterium]|nr:CapA family protein [Peptoniphilaceae bacterium]MDY6018594.1 CapA family protein [Anaerococcus sp.]